MTDKKVEQAAESTFKMGATAEYDPFETTEDAHQIKAHPEGYRLYWCNPNLRDRKGWRGWIPVEYDSEIGRNLGDYLNDPPLKYEGSKSFDNTVRRGTDLVLCYMPIGMWSARYRAKQEKINGRVRGVRGDANRNIREGVNTFGPGLTDSVRPRKGFVPGVNTEVEPAADGAVRRRLFNDEGK